MDNISYLCRHGSAVSDSGDIHTSTNEAYGKVWGGQREELVDISHGEPPPPPSPPPPPLPPPPPPPAKLEEIYEVPFVPQPLPQVNPSPPFLSLILLLKQTRKTLLSMMSFLEICDSTFTCHGVNVDCTCNDYWW